MLHVGDHGAEARYAGLGERGGNHPGILREPGESFCIILVRTVTLKVSVASALTIAVCLDLVSDAFLHTLASTWSFRCTSRHDKTLRSTKV